MRQRTPWVVFVAALIVVVAVMGLVTSTLVDVDARRRDADRRGAHEEQVRLALWRLDSETTPLLMQEIAAMPLLGDPSTEPQLPEGVEHVRGRFVVDANAAVRLIGDDEDGLAPRLEALIALRPLMPLLPEPERADAVARLENPVQRANATRAGQPVATKGRYSLDEQRAFNDNELARRLEAVTGNFEGYGSSIANTLDGFGATANGTPRPPRPAGAVRPVWAGDELFLLRRVRVEDGEEIHGVWLDWPALHDRLLAQIAEPLPHAALIAVTDEALGQTGNLLATLPVRLVPGAPNVILESTPSLLPSIALGWAGVLAAIVAVFAVLRWSLALSERRATFVSTVTHELRTPLTTFRMYTEMLQEGMVDEAKRAHYVATLKKEADRLGDLVENVLAYARIESDRVPLSPETMTTEALVERVHERLAARAQAGGLELRLDLAEHADATLRVDPAAAEQILFNLVDNAAKYGPSKESPHVELTVRSDGPRLSLCVRDYGPGIPADERRAIFDPFTKANADQSGAKPGVGLGLALSRRLARQLGGELTLEDAEPGARFVLSLPKT